MSKEKAGLFAGQEGGSKARDQANGSGVQSGPCKKLDANLDHGGVKAGSRGVGYLFGLFRRIAGWNRLVGHCRFHSRCYLVSIEASLILRLGYRSGNGLESLLRKLCGY